MKNRTMGMVTSEFGAWKWVMLAAGAAAAVLFGISAWASAPQVPWECSNYSEEAQARCMNAFIEQQREQIEKLESQLRDQRETVGQLKNQLDRQAATTAELQQQLSQRPATSMTPLPYVYTYAYPPVGLGLYLGRPWVYGPPYFHHPYWGPRFYGRWGRPW